MDTTQTRQRLTRKQVSARGVDAHQRNAALRAVDDPIVLAKAARIVRAAIERGKLTKADLDGPVVQPSREQAVS